MTHDDEGVAATAQANLSAVLNESTTTQLERAVHKIAGEAMQLESDLILSDEVAQKFCRADVIRSLISILGIENGESFTVWHPDPLPTGEKDIRLLLITPSAGRRVSVMPVDDLEPLELMLHSTNQVVVHWHERRPRAASDAVRKRRIHDVNPGLPDVWSFRPEVTLRESAEQAYADLFSVIDEAGLTGRLGGTALYLRDRSGTSLRLAARRGAVSAPGEVDLDSRDNLVLVVQRRRPRVVNRARTERAQQTAGRSSWFGAQEQPADFSEVIVPIAGGIGDDPGSVAGALVVQRETISDAGDFAARDLDDLELLGMQFALRRTNLLFAEVTDRLAELTANSILLSVSPLDDPDPSSNWCRVPFDFSQARRTLTAALALVYQHANAGRASLYLMSWDQQFLVRVASQGQALDEVDGDIPLAKSGLGVARRAFITGRRQVVDDGRARGAVGPSASQWRERSLRSALAIPISLFDRVVGVLILTSPQPSAFVETQRFVEALALHMSLILMFAQRAQEQRGFVIASSTAVHAHEILKRVDLLRECGDTEVVALADQIQQFVDSGQRPSTHSTNLSSSPYEILDEVAREVEVSEWIVWDKVCEEVPPLSPTVAMALKRAAHEVLKNSKSHLRFEKSARVSLRGRLHQRGGMPRLLLDITQSADGAVPEEIVSKIYRTPIESATAGAGVERRHFGAFIAGYWMRAVGGDIFLRENRATDGVIYVSTTLEVPIYTLAPLSARTRHAEPRKRT